MADSLSGESGALNFSRLYHDVLLKRLKLDTAVQKGIDLNHRQLVYEMAVCVCNADGQQGDAERSFLADLRRQLAVDPMQARALGLMPWHLPSGSGCWPIRHWAVDIAYGVLASR